MIVCALKGTSETSVHSETGTLPNNYSNLTREVYDSVKNCFFGNSLIGNANPDPLTPNYRYARSLDDKQPLVLSNM